MRKSRPRKHPPHAHGNTVSIFVGDRETDADARVRAREELDECKALVRALRTPAARVA